MNLSCSLHKLTISEVSGCKDTAQNDVCEGSPANKAGELLPTSSLRNRPTLGSLTGPDPGPQQTNHKAFPASTCTQPVHPRVLLLSNEALAVDSPH